MNFRFRNLFKASQSPQSMIPLKFSPEWFYLPSIIIDFFSVLVLILISITSLEYYRLNKSNRRYYHLALSFFIISISLFFKLITNMTVYYDFISGSQSSAIITTLNTIRDYNVFSYLTFAVFNFLNLMGLYMLYSIYQNKQSKSSIFLIGYFILILTYFSYLDYFIFYLTSFILLTLITSLYMNRYKENKYNNTLMLSYSFGVIAISQFLFIFTSLSSPFYITGEIIQLIGYALLLIVLRRIMYHGKKKK